MALLANPAAAFNEPYEEDVFSHEEPIVEEVEATDATGKTVLIEVTRGYRQVTKKATIDPCPDGLRGYGWFSIGSNPVLQPGERLGVPDYEADPVEPVIHNRTKVIASTDEARAAALDVLEAELVRQVETEAERARKRIYAPSPSKSAIHARKAQQAAEILAGATPEAGKHAYIVEEAALRDMTPGDFAALVMARVNAVADAGKPIELAQQAAELSIAMAKAAGDADAMRAAAAVDWSTVGGA